jgi:hypothetical protein
MINRPAINPDLSGHPFRRTMPAHVLRPLPQFEPEVEQALKSAASAAAGPAEQRASPVDPRQISLKDVRQFLIAYCACFLVIATFIF